MTIIRASIRALIVPLFAATGAFALLPSSSNAAEEISGKAVYERYCAVCHGIDGKGGGPMAEVLKPRRRDGAWQPADAGLGRCVPARRRQSARLPADSRAGVLSEEHPAGVSELATGGR